MSSTGPRVGARTLVCASILLQLAACGGDEKPVPAASGAMHTMAEDAHFAGSLDVSYEGSAPLKFELLSSPRNGVVTLDPASGMFQFQPATDYFGDDNFTFRATADGKVSNVAMVRFEVQPVNDAPVLQSLEDLSSSPDSWGVPFAILAGDADADVLAYAAVSDDPAVASVTIDPATGHATIYPRAAGRARISVTVNDGHTAQLEAFEFLSAPVRAQRSVDLPDPQIDALGIVNTADVPVTFKLRLNGRLFAADREQILEDALAQPSGIGRDDPIARLWRFVNRSTVHSTSLTASLWVHDPAVLLNSVGFGLCDDRMMMLVNLATMLDIPARTWDIEGHVIPEFRIDGRWEVWDPDYGVVYFNENGDVASLAELQSRPDLITAPLQPMLPVDDDAYSAMLGWKYGTFADNRIVDYYYMHPVGEQAFTLTLPAGGRLTLGGQYGEAPVTYLGALAANYAHAVFEYPAGTTGQFVTGLVPTRIEGVGKVRVGNSSTFEIDSDELHTALSYDTAFPGDVALDESQSPIAISYLVNPVFTRLDVRNAITAEGLNAGALQFEVRNLEPTRQVQLYLAE